MQYYQRLLPTTVMVATAASTSAVTTASSTTTAASTTARSKASASAAAARSETATSSTSAAGSFIESGALGDFLQFGVDHLVGLGQHLDQIFGLGAVAGSEEGVGSAFVVFSSRPSNAMNVILRIVGVIVVDDEFDVVDVQAAGGHIRGHQNGGGASPEFTQHPITFLVTSKILV